MAGIKKAADKKKNVAAKKYDAEILKFGRYTLQSYLKIYKSSPILRPQRF